MSIFQRIILIIGCTLFCIIYIDAQQNIEIPPVINISPAPMKAGYQNWSITQTPDRLIYAGNSDGLFVFNGSEWSKIPLDFQGTIRSVHYFHDKIYIGGFNSMGFLTREPNGKYHYSDLNHLVKDGSLDKEEVWHITDWDDKVLFQSFSIIWIYDGKSLQKIMPPGNIMFIRKAGDKLLVQVIDSGIYEIGRDFTFRLISGTETLQEFTVSGIIPLDEHSFLVSTEKNGIFQYSGAQLSVWNPHNQPAFQNYQINRFIRLDRNLIAAGTIRNGVLITDIYGNIRHVINKKTAIQNNTVLSLLQDHDGNLWAGLDKGISFIQLKSPYLMYPDIEGQLGTVYSAIEDDSGNFIAGTNQGIFFRKSAPETKKTDLNDTDFELIPGSQGHVWQLLRTRHGILAGHNSGTYLVEKNRIRKISAINGGYFTLPVTPDQRLFLQGTYTGLILLEYDGSWKVKTRLPGINQPVKAIIPESDNIFWLTGPVKGIFKIKLSDDFSDIEWIREYNEKNGIQSSSYPEIVKIEGKIYLKQKSGYYTYDPETDSFRQSKDFTFSTPEYSLRPLKDGLYGKIYRDSLVLVHKDKGRTVLRIKVNRDYFSSAQLSKDKYIFCLDEGYAILDLSKSMIADPVPPPPLVFRVELRNTMSAPFSDSGNQLKLPYSQNSFTIHYFQTAFGYKPKFRIRLEGYDKDWRSWTEQTSTEYNNIQPGKYLLKIESDNGAYIPPVNITITPPWYMSGWSWAAYVILLGLLIRLLYKYLRYRIEKTEQKLKEENERLVREHQIELENQRLQASNIAKSKEVANTTIHLVKKNELLQEIKSELNHIRQYAGGNLTGKEYQKLMHLINENITAQEDWQLFESSFHDVHESFMKKLKQKYPNLTRDDLVLAAYLKMNLSTKEIAPLFNLSIRGLENKRYRLRKKMGLDFEINLSDFFQKFDA